MGLTDAQLTSMRTTLNTLMPDTCNILSVTRTSDGQGGFTDVWGTATASVKCRIDSGGATGAAGRENVGAASLLPFESWLLTLPYDTTITAAHRVEVSSVTYNVTSVDKSKSWNAEVVASLEVVT